MPNPPSIPSHNNVFGYEYDNGKLTKQSNTEKVYAGNAKDSVGPGNYEISVVPKQAHGTTKWIAPSKPN
jgi:hypothetical protein